MNLLNKEQKEKKIIIYFSSYTLEKNTVMHFQNFQDFNIFTFK